jgi:hypothetical protein
LSAVGSHKRVVFFWFSQYTGILILVDDFGYDRIVRSGGLVSLLVCGKLLLVSKSGGRTEIS